MQQETECTTCHYLNTYDGEMMLLQFLDKLFMLMWNAYPHLV